MKLPASGRVLLGWFVVRREPRATTRLDVRWRDVTSLRRRRLLSDRMEHGDAESVRLHLLADSSYQEGMVRFIENHDEPRAASAFPDGKGRAAAVVRDAGALVRDPRAAGAEDVVGEVLARGKEQDANDNRRPTQRATPGRW